MVTMKMIGSEDKPGSTPFKGKEAKDLIQFFVEMLQMHRPKNCEDLLLAGLYLRRVVHLLDVSPLVPAPHVVQEIHRATIKFLVHGLNGGVHPIAKTHQATHIGEQVRLHGNLKHSANFLDESMNQEVAGIAGKAYSSVWCSRIFVSWKQLKRRMPRGWVLGPVD